MRFFFTFLQNSLCYPQIFSFSAVELLAQKRLHFFKRSLSMLSDLPSTETRYDELTTHKKEEQKTHEDFLIPQEGDLLCDSKDLDEHTPFSMPETAEDPYATDSGSEYQPSSAGSIVSTSSAPTITSDLERTFTPSVLADNEELSVSLFKTGEASTVTPDASTVAPENNGNSFLDEDGKADVIKPGNF